MLGTAQTDTLRAERSRLFRVFRRIGVGSHAHCLVFVGKFHNSAEVAAVGIGGNGGNEAIVDVTRRTVEGNAVALVIYFTRKGELLVLFVHFDVAAARNAAGTHAARNDCRVRSLSAAHGENALRVFHALDIFGGSFKTDEHDLLALLAFDHGVFRREDDLTCRRTGGSRNTLSDNVLLIRLFERFGIELRVKKHVERLRVDLHKRFLLGDHAFVDEVACDLNRRGSRAFTVTRLQHIEFLVLDGEFHILHVAVVVFKRFADFEELLVHFGEDFRHFGDGHRRADACNDVFALRVGEELAHEPFFTRRGITRERNARTAVVAHVAERHHLHVDRRTPRIRDIVIHTVDIRAGVVPRTEHRFDRLEKLFLGIVGEVLFELLFVLFFELHRKIFQIVRRQIDVLRHALLLFHLVDELFKVFFTDFHNDVGEHLDKSSVAVPRPAGVVRFGRNGIDDRFVQTEVENGVHHAGHRRSRTRTDGNEQGVLFVAELLARDFFHLVDVFHDFGLDRRIDLSAVLVILRASLGRNREALGNGKTDVGHFRKVRALAAENFAHFRVTFGEKVTILFCHVKVSS